MRISNFARKSSWVPGLAIMACVSGSSIAQAQSILNSDWFGRKPQAGSIISPEPPRRAKPLFKDSIIIDVEHASPEDEALCMNLHYRIRGSAGYQDGPSWAVFHVFFDVNENGDVIDPYIPDSGHPHQTRERKDARVADEYAALKWISTSSFEPITKDGFPVYCRNNRAIYPN